jgi:N-acetylmuramic acid 6-phosphate etherase
MRAVVISIMVRYAGKSGYGRSIALAIQSAPEWLDAGRQTREPVRMDLQAFLKVCDQFKLGDLVTEQPHPETVGLAELAQRDLPAAIECFHRADRLAIDTLASRLAPAPAMVSAMRRTLDGGGRIFIAGCGATGRLALSLETFAREAWLPEDQPDSVMSFMAGGDAALIRSIEAFEDFPSYGARQLMELGFRDSDLLVAITEGGETPFVIGACEKAAEVATEAPWFLFCNPPEVLRRVAERSRRVLDSDRIRSFCLEVGPMALSGSTRLQATTVQMLVAGACLSEALGHESAASLFDQFSLLISRHDPAFLAPFIEAEATVYQAGDHVLYQTDAYGITVLTDTTERSPTFSLAPFENTRRPADPPSLCYLSLPEAPDSASAWHHLLHRAPRTLEWPEVGDRATLATLLGHDISATAPEWRAARHPGVRQLPYLVHGEGPILEFGGLTHDLGLGEAPLLLRHLMLKCCLNLQSTLVMGRIGRFESNLMTYVRPSNYKLIDRAARYAQNKFLQETGKPLSYEEAVRQAFENLA